MKKTAITLESLAESIDHLATSVQNGFDSTDRKSVALEDTIDQLAVSVKQGFDAMDQRFVGLEDNLDQLAVSVKQRFDAVDERFDQMENRLTDVEQGQDTIKLKLDNVAYRFEINSLEQRVNVIEGRLHIA